jgi:hypothetical protein
VVETETDFCVGQLGRANAEVSENEIDLIYAVFMEVVFDIREVFIYEY